MDPITHSREEFDAWMAEQKQVLLTTQPTDEFSAVLDPAITEALDEVERTGEALREAMQDLEASRE